MGHGRPLQGLAFPECVEWRAMAVKSSLSRGVKSSYAYFIRITLVVMLKIGINVMYRD